MNVEKNITLAIDSLRGGGAQRICVNVANGLSELGWKVDLLVLNMKHNDFLKNLSKKVNLIDFKKNHLRTSTFSFIKFIYKKKPNLFLVFNYEFSVMLIILRIIFKFKYKIIARNISSLSQKKKELEQKYQIEVTYRPTFVHWPEGLDVVNLAEDTKKDLLKNTHWSAYRNINIDLFPNHTYTESFIDFCKNNIPRTMKNLEVYNKFPEDLLEPAQYREGSFIMDANNLDAEIFKDSAVTIILDTLANTKPSLYNSNWHDVEKEIGSTSFYTKKILKPILHKRPFIACIGRGKGINKYLSDMGFQTFESVWDESYFDADTPKERVDRVVDLCYNLSKLEITEIHEKTKEICEHNYNVLTKTDWVEWFLSQIQTTLHIRQAIT